MSRRERDAGATDRNVMAAALLLGAGLAGFADGTLLHEILQWHNMVSHIHPPHTMAAMRLNMFWDGIFHAGCWVATALGLALLWHGARGGGRLPSTTGFVGWLVLGASLFNLVEGLS